MEEKKEETFFITTAIFYVSDIPHIGHAYEVIAADILSRYWKRRGRDVFFLTGTDEHGQKIAQAAQMAGLSPRQLVDNFVNDFKKLWEVYHIHYDHFIRTTDDYHIKGVQEWIERLTLQGDIYKGTYTG